MGHPSISRQLLLSHCIPQIVVNKDEKFTCPYILWESRNGYLFLMLTIFSMVNTQFNAKIKCFRSNIAAGLKLLKIFKSKGMYHQFSCIATPQQNLVVERKHQHILQVVRALKFQSQIPIHFLG